MKNIKILVILSLIGLVLLPISKINGQEASSTLEQTVTPGSTPPCFDYYPYGALRITPDLDKDIYKPGETAQLTLTVTNTHSKTSLYNAKVILQIRKFQKETVTSLLIGDNFILGEGLQYPAGETKENTFSFVIPKYLSSDSYQGYIYITDNDYTIAGLPFTQDVTGAIVSFRVENPEQQSFNFPYFQEEKAMINNTIKANPFFPPPRISESDLPAKISVPIYNSIQKEKK